MNQWAEETGTIEGIEAAEVTVTGSTHPIQYWVSDNGFPDALYQKDICGLVEETGTEV